MIATNVWVILQAEQAGHQLTIRQAHRYDCGSCLAKRVIDLSSNHGNTCRLGFLPRGYSDVPAALPFMHLSPHRCHHLVATPRNRIVEIASHMLDMNSISPHFVLLPSAASFSCFAKYWMISADETSTRSFSSSGIGTMSFCSRFASRDCWR